MNSVAKSAGCDQLQTTRALKFIQLQLLDLARDCDTRIQSGPVSYYYFLELQNKLEKLLHETRAAWSSPLRKPEQSDFTTIKTVGGGGFGTVNLVRHKETGQAFAMKTIKRQSLTRPSHVQQVLVERDILTFTDNPFVVSMFCSFETKDDLCMVMEYAGGGDCASLLNHHKRLPVDMARTIVAETILAVEYLHSYGILHRDLKPSNLLISSAGHIKVTDFGLSKVGPVTMTAVMDKSCINKIVREFTDQEISGTAAYIAPEVVVRQGYGKPVDWWSVGIILYEFLLGSPPFTGQKVKEILYNVVTNKLTWPQEEDGVPADAQDLIRHLLKKRCERRLGTGGASEVKEHPFFQDVDWSELLNQDPLFVPQTGHDKLSTDDVSSGDDKSSSDDKYTDNDTSTDDDKSSDDEESSSDDESSDVDEPTDDNKSSDDEESSSDDESSDVDEPTDDNKSSDDEESSSDDESSDVDEPTGNDKSTDSGTETPEVPNFCSVAFRFRKVYGSPAPLSPFTFFKESLLSTRPGHSMVEEEQEEEQVDEGYEEEDSDNLQDGEDDGRLLTSTDSAEPRQETLRRRRRTRRKNRKRGKKRGKRRGKKRRRCKGRRRRRKERRRRKKGRWRRRRQRRQRA